VGYAVAPVAFGNGPARRIAITASKFAFDQAEIRVRRGEPVTLVVVSPDFVHGLSVPDFGVRADGIPGRTVELTFTPTRSGRFTFLCDNFCGEGHDKMMGVLVVSE
jgi:cytochrome c oxidase subunit 2